MKIKKKVMGEVVKGKGEGKYYMEKAGYQKQFKEKLGFKPFPGTLNLKIGRIPGMKNPITIDGFEEDGKYFGYVRCYPAEINGIGGFLIFPSESEYENVVEFISPFNLREKLNLKDGDKVILKIC